jgi:alcohol dehydrogenase class IV
MDSFEYTANPSRVIFGSGSIKKLPNEIKRLGLKSPLFLSTPQQISQAEDIQNIVTDASIHSAGIYTKATMHTPSHVTEDAMSFMKTKDADCIVSIGGGSTTGLGKAISIRTGLPHICVPTTYAGSEMTPILGETQDGKKTTRSDPKILPVTVIYDVDFTMTLPPSLSATSGVNAIAHAVESLYAKNTNPIISLFALDGTKALAESLPEIIDNPTSLPAREKAQYGAWLCGVCLGTSAMALHHKLCHTLGGSFNLPHAETHTIVLPHALSYNAPAIPKVMEQLATALPGSDGDATKGLNLLLEKLKVKRALKDFGMKEEDVDKATDIAMSAQYPNPRALEKEAIRELIRRAWAGEPARADL